MTSERHVVPKYPVVKPSFLQQCVMIFQFVNHPRRCCNFASSLGLGPVWFCHLKFQRIQVMNWSCIKVWIINKWELVMGEDYFLFNDKFQQFTVYMACHVLNWSELFMRDLSPGQPANKNWHHTEQSQDHFEIFVPVCWIYVYVFLNLKAIQWDYHNVSRFILSHKCTILSNTFHHKSDY